MTAAMLGSAAQHTAAEGNTWNKSLLLSNDYGYLLTQIMVVGRMTELNWNNNGNNMK